MTVLITRACAAVSCPLDDASETECLVGQCVPPACLDPRECAAPECESDADCVQESASCVRSRCAEGACVAVPDDARCAAPAICSVARGECVVPPTQSDAGTMRDAGPAPVPFARCYPRSLATRQYLFCLEAGVPIERARSFCEEQGMRLLRVDDAEEERVARAATADFGGASAIWIDGSDAAVEGEWRFSHGTLFWRNGPQGGHYSNWAGGEPGNNPGNPEHCIGLITRASEQGWFDLVCTSSLPFACEAR